MNNRTARVHGMPVRAIFLWIALLPLYTSATAQPLTNNQVTSLSTMGKVWGFLKYYHPAVAKGRYNWDSVLVTKVPVFLSANNAQQLDHAVSSWLTELGTVDSCATCDTMLTDKLTWNFDTAWISHSSFSPGLQTRLRYILANRNQGTHFYAAYGMSRVIRITNENPYAEDEFQFPSAPYRLLTLYRYWNIVNYFSPYKYLTPKKWEKVLDELIPQFYEAKDTLQYHLSIIKMIRALEDGHSTLTWSRPLNNFFGEYTRVPFICSIIEGKAVVTYILNDSLCRAQGIALYDVITAIDDEPVEKHVRAYRPYVYDAGNEDFALMSLCFHYLFAGKTSTCTITRLTAKGSNRLTIQRYNHPIPIRTSMESTPWKILPGNIGYIDMKHLLSTQVHDMMDSLQATKGIIIDVRNYPKGTARVLAARLCSGKFQSARFSYPEINFPGMFKYHPDLSEGNENSIPYKGKVILLANALSQSHAEFSLMILQGATQTTTIGSTTAGADGNVTETFVLPGGFRTRFSGLGVYYPDGGITQRTGIRIDIVCRPTLKGILRGKDELIEAAIKTIHQN